jgi:hypothetical protein
VDLVQRVAVVAEVGDEVGVDLEFEEAGAEGGLGGLLLRGVAAFGDGGVVVLQEGEEAVGVGFDVLLDAVGDVVEGASKPVGPLRSSMARAVAAMRLKSSRRASSTLALVMRFGVCPACA